MSEHNDDVMREPGWENGSLSRRQLLAIGALSGLAWGSGLLSLTDRSMAQVRNEGLPKGRAAAVLFRGPDGVLYRIPQSALKPFKVSEPKARELQREIPELMKPLTKLAGPRGKEWLLGAIAIDWS
jgi:hypothetical protein